MVERNSREGLRAITVSESRSHGFGLCCVKATDKEVTRRQRVRAPQWDGLEGDGQTLK